MMDRAPCAMLLRDIEHTPYQDGHLPWPYVCLDEAEVHSLARLHPDLVSITGVILPPEQAEVPASWALQPFKPHFVFSPTLPPTPLSRKSLANLAEGRASWDFAEATSPEDWACFQRLYQDLVERRGLALSPFNFAPAHFDTLRNLPHVRLYGARHDAEWGAMLCAARFGTELHLIHIVVSAEGLRTNASYALMQAMIDLCRDRQMTLFMGGVPAGDNGGMLKFKKRWTNETRMSYLVRLIVRPDIYDKLRLPDNVFFPAYRTSWRL